ncbi:CehA/McbA family metallohydrolase [Streptomyces sp. NPDC059740]|uniref:CehA/McbA family metallohydrolase n=1 Tax=Streptomyces sp. NPDC059740 TaxID=3346926 RepID=UPI00364C6F5F
MRDHQARTSRRSVLATGAAAALTLSTVSFADAAEAGAAGAEEGATRTRTVRGRLAAGAADFVYVPVEVPPGVRQLAVSYSYDRPEVPAGTQGNACDVGLFDERGTALGSAGFRGWSGGARTEFFVRADEATPGYVAGPVGAGTWHVVLGPYTVAPQGMAYEVTVALTFGEAGRTPRPVYPPRRARGRGRAWYRGDNHLHTVHSDGKYTPADIAALARRAGLDFVTSSDHNTHTAHGAWQGLWGEDLLVITGEEITTRNGHVLAMGVEPGTWIDWRYRARDNAFGRYAQQVRRAGGLVIPAHPHATCVGCNWKFGFNEADAVEVWNGPFTPDDEVTVAEWDNTLVAYAQGRRGGWLPGVGHSDAHRDPDVVGLPQTVVLAEDLSVPAIQDGIRAGRVWIAESAAVDLAFSASGEHGEHAGIGERLRVADGTGVALSLRVAGAAGCSVRFVTDQGVRHEQALPDSGEATVVWRTTPGNAAYVRAEVRHPAAGGPLPGAMAAMTNPVFLGEW